MAQSRIGRILGAAVDHWIEHDHNYPKWLRPYIHESGEAIRLTIGIYDGAHEYEGSVTVNQAKPGSTYEYELDIPPHSVNMKEE